MEYNKYNLYSMNFESSNLSQKDEVDACIQDISDMNVYEDLRAYLVEHFGDFNGEKWVDYPKLHKHVFLRLEEDKIEICVLKNEQQYFGKGWKLIKDDSKKSV